MGAEIKAWVIVDRESSPETRPANSDKDLGRRERPTGRSMASQSGSRTSSTWPACRRPRGQAMGDRVRPWKTRRSSPNFGGRGGDRRQDGDDRLCLGRTRRRPRTPGIHDRTPGGSSSGSAAAVASGMCLLPPSGTQTGGSMTRGRRRLRGEQLQAVPTFFEMTHGGNCPAGQVVWIRPA